MADMRIDEATEATSISADDAVPAAVGSTPAARKVKFGTIRDFVVAAVKDIAGLGTGETISAATDLVLMKRAVSGGYDQRHVGIGELAEAVAEKLFDKEGAAAAAGEAKVVIQDTDGDAKTLELEKIAEYVQGYFEENDASFGINIDGMGEAEDTDEEDLIPSLQSRGGIPYKNKITLSQVADEVMAEMTSKAASKVDAIASTDALLVVTPASGSDPAKVKKVLLSASGITANAAAAPATTTSGKVPKWGASQKTLEDGYSVQTALRPATSSSTDGAAADTAFATEKAVRTAIDGKMAKCASSTTDGNVPQWDGTGGGALKTGLALRAAVRPATGGGSGGNADDASLATEKAVRTELDGKANKCDTATVDGNIPQWDGTDGADFKAGLALSTSVRASASASDAAVATEKAVRTAVDERIEKISASNDGYIPQWDGTTGKKLKNGLSVQTTLRASSSASDAAVATEKAVRTAFDNFGGIVYSNNGSSALSSLDDLPSTGDHKEGDFRRARYSVGVSTRMGLFMCLGYDSVSLRIVWKYLCDVSDALPTA